MNDLIFISNLLLAVLVTIVCQRLGYVALIAWFVCQALFANLFVLKQIQLFGMHTTASDIFAIIANFSLYLIWREYGNDIAQKTCRITAVILIFFAITCALHVSYIPSIEDTAQPAYEILLKPQLYMQVVSQFSWFISQNSYIFMLNLLLRILNVKNIGFFYQLFLIVSSQVIDSILFSVLFLQFYVSDIYSILLFSLVLKAISAIVFMSFLYLRNIYLDCYVAKV